MTTWLLPSKGLDHLICMGSKDKMLSNASLIPCWSMEIVTQSCSWTHDQVLKVDWSLTQFLLLHTSKQVTTPASHTMVWEVPHNVVQTTSSLLCSPFRTPSRDQPLGHWVKNSHAVNHHGTEAHCQVNWWRSHLVFFTVLLLETVTLRLARQHAGYSTSVMRPRITVSPQEHNPAVKHGSQNLLLHRQIYAGLQQIPRENISENRIIRTNFK